MTATAAVEPARDKVLLIPWDATDDGHFRRMVDQRVACGWREAEVPEWQEKMLSGQKFLYWVVLADDLPGREDLLQKHIERYENEREPLTDTATAVMRTAREPTGRSFVPVGHIALETLPARNEEYGLDASTYWIMSLYISWVLHSSGIGRSAMAQTERIAALPPLRASTVALDTVTKSFQLSEDAVRAQFDARGLPRPPVVRANEEWYRRQGYQVFHRVEDGITWFNPATKKQELLAQVFLKKELAA